MPTLPVRHALGSYDVLIRSGLLAEADGRVRKALGDRRPVVITDTTVARLIPAWGLGALTASPLTVPPGESAKTREHWADLTDQLLDRGLGRDGAIVAVGGGSIGDLAGFVAATYLRGIPVVQVPTTLLAMLDASVGGKVAVDTAHGKNLIGAFHPPALVLADPATLTTLPERDYRAGFAEAVKHGLVADAAYLDWMVAHARELAARDLGALEHLVARSVEIKATVVVADERESGQRAILNAGHTVAHAIEQVSAFGVRHGEAVGLGLVAECRLAERLGHAGPGLAARAADALRALGLPTRLERPLGAEALVTAMGTDKKNRAGALRFALVAEPGRPAVQSGEWTTAAPGDVVAGVLREAIGA